MLEEQNTRLEVDMSKIIQVSKGSFNNTKKFLEQARKFRARELLENFGAVGVAALEKSTPKASGKTAASWSYVIEESDGKTTINWINNNINNGVNIAIIIQYGHGTKNGGYVAGRDYINPALRPLFDKASKEIGEAVMSL